VSGQRTGETRPLLRDIWKDVSNHKEGKFKPGRQEDAQEWLLALLSLISTPELNRLISSQQKHVWSHEIGDESNSAPVAQTVLLLRFPPHDSTRDVELTELLHAEYCKSEVVELRRSSTGLEERTLRLCGDPARILIIALGRFGNHRDSMETDGIQLKNTTAVRIPLVLNTLPYHVDSSQMDSQDHFTYRLVAVCNHNGKYMHTGHYTAHVRGDSPGQDGGQWFLCDDNVVSAAPEFATNGSVTSSEPYLCFYEIIHDFTPELTQNVPDSPVHRAPRGKRSPSLDSRRSGDFYTSRSNKRPNLHQEHPQNVDQLHAHNAGGDDSSENMRT
jgi:hypothetical protein